MGIDSRERLDSPRSWLVAITGAVAMVFTFGTTFSYGVFLKPFSETFAIAPVVLSSVFSMMLFMFFIGAGVISVAAARLPTRPVIAACGAATGLAAPSLYVVESYLGLAVIFALVGLSLGTMFVVLASVVPQWFRKYQGTATGIIFAGNGLGLFVLPPAWQIAIGRLGVRKAFLTIMLLTTVVFLVAGVLCRRPRTSARMAGRAEGLLEWVVDLLGTRTFKLLFIGIGLSLGWYMLLAAYATDLFTTRGLSETNASAAFGLVGGFSVISRLGSGYVADIVGFRRTFLSSVMLAAGGIALLFLPSLSVTAVAICLTGLGLGGIATMYIPLLLQAYNPSRDTAVIGVFNVAIGIVALAVPPVGTAIITYTGSYGGAILLTFCMLVGALWTVATGTR